MSTTLIEVRPAKAADASAVASTHDEAWRSAYQGIIPGAELEKLINRRGPQWWDSAIRKGSRVSVLVFGDKVAGYANYGRNRARSLHFEGEIYELYLRPEFQGLGFGRRLFTSARRDLVQSGLKSMVIWALSDNDPRDRILPRPRRPDGGALLGEIRAEVARQGRVRLDQLRLCRILQANRGWLRRASRPIQASRYKGSFTTRLIRRLTSNHAEPSMRIDAISIGINPPHEVNVIIEVPVGGEPIKYEMDKEAGTLVVDRFLYTAMRYPGNYGFIPHTLSGDGDPCDVLVANTRAIVPGAVMSVRPVGVLLMEDEAGGDEKIIAVPSSKLTQRYDKVKTYSDLPEITLQQIQHFFEHYKDLEPGKWVKVLRWGDAEDAHQLILEGIARAKAKVK